jgi:hypothetical protein
MDKKNSKAYADKINAVATGVFFIVAALAAIIGLKLYDPVLSNPDYLIMGTSHSNQIVLGAVFELILACTATGTAIMLYPYLKKFNESWGLAYVCFRLLEVVCILVGIFSVLAIITLSKSFTTASNPDIDNFKAIGIVLKGIHGWTFMLGPNFMLGINTFMYSYVFYKSNLVPGKIAVIGITGAVSIIIAALLEMSGTIQQISTWGMLLAIPIFVYEMTLAVWLIVKGFNLPQ